MKRQTKKSILMVTRVIVLPRSRASIKMKPKTKKPRLSKLAWFFNNLKDRKEWDSPSKPHQKWANDIERSMKSDGYWPKRGSKEWTPKDIARYIWYLQQRFWSQIKMDPTKPQDRKSFDPYGASEPIKLAIEVFGDIYTAIRNKMLRLKVCHVQYLVTRRHLCPWRVHQTEIYTYRWRWPNTFLCYVDAGKDVPFSKT